MFDPSAYRFLNFFFSASGTQKWTADKDYIFTCATSTSTAANILVTVDPTQTATEMNAPTTTRLVETVLWRTPTTSPALFRVQVPVIEGTTLAVISTGAATATIYLEPPPSQLS